MSMVVVFIFVAEMLVVTIGTLRIIFVSRGHKTLAPLLGFFEILIWLYAMREVMQNLDDMACFMAFALGFTLGNFLGILIEKALALGMLHVRIITHRDPQPLLQSLRQAQFGVTLVQGHGATGPVNIVLTVIRRKQMRKVAEIIQSYDPNAFYAVDELQTASAGIFPLTQSQRRQPALQSFSEVEHAIREMDQQTSQAAA